MNMDHIMCRLILTLVAASFVTETVAVDVTNSGYFPGRCGQMSPCGQLCHDLPSNGFVCSCKDGYTLHENGYSCIETVPNPSTTIRPELYDLDAVEQELPSESSDGPGKESGAVVVPETPADPEQAARLRDEEDLEEMKLEKEADAAESLEELKWSGLTEAEGDEYLGDEAETEEADADSEDLYEDELEDPDDDIEYLDNLSKRARDPDRKKGRNRDGSRKGKGKGRKGKGRKYKDGSMGRTSNPKALMDQPMNDIFVKEGKIAKDKSGKSSAENEVGQSGRPMSCYELRCLGAGKCVQDEMRAGGGVRCQCPLGKEGEFCEKDIVVQYPKFMGTGYMAFPTLRGAYRDMAITLEFKPDTHNGLLLYSGDFPHPMSDFFSVALVDGRIEFRFDCGTGMAQIRSQNTIELGQWNTVTIKRNDWYGWLQLNEGAQERGRSVGLFSRITFREDLYLGGYKNTSALGLKTGMQWGFVGCVRFMEINGKVYDMRQGAFVGDAIHGVDVGECSSNVCDSVKCQNGGSCVAETADTSVCLCPLGTAGDKCESRIDIHVPSFSGQSYLTFLGLGQSVLSFLEGEIVFKASEPTGLILYNGYATDRTGDFLSLALANGFVDFRFDLGTGPAVIRSREPVSMNEWHVIKFKRTGRNGELTVDSQAPVQGISKGGYTQLTLTLDLYVGGHRNFDEVARKAQIRTAFKGCIQKVVISEKPLKLIEEALAGVNIDNCEHPCKGQPCLNGGRCVPIKDYYRCSCPVGFENSNCEDRIVRYRYRYRYRRDVQEPITIPKFSGTSHILYREDRHDQNQYRDPARQIRLRLNGETTDIQMRIKTDKPNGVLLWLGERYVTPNSDYMVLAVENGYAQFTFNLGSGEVTVANRETRVDDGKWHKIRAQRYKKVGYLEVDGMNIVEGTASGALEQFFVSDPVFLGAIPDEPDFVHDRYSTNFDGCISNVTLATNYHVDLIDAADEVINIQQCDDH